MIRAFLVGSALAAFAVPCFAADLVDTLAGRAELQPSTASRPAPQGTETYAACREAISALALPYAATKIEVTMTGPVVWEANQMRTATLFVRIVYDRRGGFETRKAHVKCIVGASGTTIVLADPSG
jgi:hypothetical protein